jgi:WD40 repeat protein
VWSVAFDPSGRVLAAGSADNTVRLWDVADPAHPVPLGVPLRGPDNYVIPVAFSPRGNLLAASAGDGTIWVWDATDPRHPQTVAVLTGHIGAVFTVAFDPRSGALASGGADKLTRLWDLDPADVARRICETVGDPITAAEWQKYVPGRPFAAPC